jgi:hypothetical protein
VAYTPSTWCSLVVLSDLQPSLTFLRLGGPHSSPGVPRATVNYGLIVRGDQLVTGIRDSAGRIWPDNGAQRCHLPRIAEHHLTIQRAYGLVGEVPVYLYGSVSVVPGGSGWGAVRIGVGDSG